MELYRKIERYFSHSDTRGAIEGLLNTGVWREVNLIHSEAGSVRGGHYHQHAEECFIILSGRIRVKLRLPLPSDVDEYQETEMQKGDVFVIPQMVEHTFEIQEDATWLNLMSIPMSKTAPDIHRYPAVV